MRFVAEHGPCAPSMAWRVVDAKHAFEHALSLGAEPADVSSAQKTLDVPAIKGIGGSLLYFVDRYGAKGSAYDAEFEWLGARDPQPGGRRLLLSRPPHPQRLSRQHGRVVRLLREAVQLPPDPLLRHRGPRDRPGLARADLPCGKIRIPINEYADDTSQIEEYLNIYSGEGIQHIACGTRDIYAHRRDAARQRSAVHAGAARHLLREDRRARAAHGEHVARMQRTAS